MNPKAQLRYLMELSFFNPDHCSDDVSESLLLGVASVKSDFTVLSDGINSIEVCLGKKSVSKRKGKQESQQELVADSLYVFKECRMKMRHEGDSVRFDLNFNGYQLIMPSYFVTKDKSFKPLHNDLSIRDHNMLKRKVS